MADDLEELDSEPEPPRNVRVHMPDGSIVPVECRYLGHRDGTHRWEAVGTVSLLSTPGAHLLVGPGARQNVDPVA